MKKAVKKTDFEYKCFPCLKQDDKVRCYMRSYDLILHMVKTHQKYPVEARHNAYYAADGTDLRDATEEEIEKYKLAATHKKRKPESSKKKSESATRVSDARKNDEGDMRKTSEVGRGGHSSRDRDADWNSRDRDSKSDKERSSSWGSRGGRDDDIRDHKRGNTGRKSSAEGGTGGYSSERDRKSRTNTDTIDEDERDRRKLADIMRRMEERKAAKVAEVPRKFVADKGKSAPEVDITTVKEKRENDAAKVVGKKNSGLTEAPKKTTNTAQRDAADADTAQRDAAMQWASGEISDVNVVTQSTIGKGSTRQRGGKKGTDEASATATEDASSLEAQNFIASQYPPVEDGVSSTVRLGRAFVSGALGKQTDDPKLFGAAVNIVDCSVKLMTTNKKAKMPVSAALPNSINLEAEEGGISHDTTFDVQLSQSATDLGMQIDLPSVDIETEPHMKDVTRELISTEAELPETPIRPGHVSTPMLSQAVGKLSKSDRREFDGENASVEPKINTVNARSPRNVILAEFNRMMDEIDVSTLVQKKLISTEPHLASAASFLNVASGGTFMGKPKPGAELETMVIRPPVIECAADATATTIAEIATAGSVAEVTVVAGCGPTKGEIKSAERQRLIRITASKSLLKDELKKPNPSSASIVSFCKAAYGEDSKGETKLETGSETMKEAKRSDVITDEITPGDMRVQETKNVSEVDVQPIDVEVKTQQDNEKSAPEEEVMSVGDSEEDEEGSDGFSTSGRNASGGESVISRGSRNRRAYESPERETTGGVRREFPGTVSRSEAGCRIYLPPTTGAVFVGANEPPLSTIEVTDAAPEVQAQITMECATAPDIPTSHIEGELTAGSNVLAKVAFEKIMTNEETPPGDAMKDTYVPKDIPGGETVVSCNVGISTRLGEGQIAVRDVALPGVVMRLLAVRDGAEMR